MENDAMDKDAYIHTSLGSTVTGIRAKFNALLTADVNRYMDITTDFIDAGACVKAYSRPVMEAKISEMAISTYDGICHAAVISLYFGQVLHGSTE